MIFLSTKENIILTIYLTIISLILFELSYFLNFTIFSFSTLLNKYLIESRLLSLVIEFVILFFTLYIYNYFTSKIYKLFNHIYIYIIFGLVDYTLLVGILKIFNILPDYQYFTTQLCLISSFIILKSVNLYSIFYINLIKYQRN